MLDIKIFWRILGQMRAPRHVNTAFLSHNNHILPPATRLAVSTRWEIFSQLFKHVYLYSFKVVGKKKATKKAPPCFLSTDYIFAPVKNIFT